MKNILIALLLASSTLAFAGPKPDKCDEELKGKVHFKLSRDRKSDLVTKTGKNMSVNVEVNNTSGATTSVKIDFYSEGKLMQSLTTTKPLAAGEKTTLTNKVNLPKGKKIDNLTVTLKNTECADVKKNTQTWVSTNNNELKTAVNEIGF